MLFFSGVWDNFNRTIRWFFQNLSTSEDRETVYDVETLFGQRELRTTFADGTSNELVISRDESRVLTTADGTEVMTEVGLDPRFGMLVPVVTKRQVTTPGGRLMTANTSRVAELEDEANPLTLLRLTSSPLR